MKCGLLSVRQFLGKGEVVSSILTGSTTKAQKLRAFGGQWISFVSFEYGTEREYDATGRGLYVDSVRQAFALPSQADVKERA